MFTVCVLLKSRIFGLTPGAPTADDAADVNATEGRGAAAAAGAPAAAAVEANGRGMLLRALLGEGCCCYFLTVPTVIISKYKFKMSLVKKHRL